MRTRWKWSSHLLCFSAVDPVEKEAAVKTRESSTASSGRSDDLGTEARRHMRRPDRRVLAKSFRAAMFVSALNRSREEGKHLNRSAARKASDEKRAAEWSGKSSYGNDRKADAIFSSSSWTSSSTSSSSCLSSPYSSWFRERELEQKRASPMAESRNHPPPARVPTRNYGSATGLFLLLLSLSVMVFCGRLFAILWTSSWLCFIPRRYAEGGGERRGNRAAGAPAKGA